MTFPQSNRPIEPASSEPPAAREGIQEFPGETRLLVVSFGFPPNSEVGTLRVTRLCRYLPEHGIRPLVLTADPAAYPYRDDTVPTPEGVSVVRAPLDRTLLDWYSAWKSKSPPRVAAPSEHGDAGSSVPRTSVETQRGLVRRQLLTLLQTPDQYRGWYRPAIDAARAILERENVAAIFSTGPPWISHLVARRLSRKFRLPWLADFRDPWARSKTHLRLPFWRRALDRRLEAGCVRLADRVICNTGHLRELFLRTYPSLPEKKFVVLTNGFDDVSFPPPAERPARSHKLCLHSGWLYAGRRIDTFCEALASLMSAGKLAPGSVRVIFLGDADAGLADAARRSAPELFANGWAEFRSRVSWRQAQEMLWDADVLLLFQGRLPLQVPAKFFDYLPTAKPIFAVVKQGALSELLESTGAGLWADPDDPREIAERFHLLLGRPAEAAPELRDAWRRRFHYRFLAGQLAELVRQTARRDLA